MEIPFGRPMIGLEEKNAVAKVLESPILVHGPRATQFESDFAAFTGAPQAVSVSSCTAGMHLIYFALGLGAGDEVVVPAMTHVATAHAVELTGAKAVFVDCQLENGNIDIAMIEAAITPRTRALAIVHYLGVPLDMPPIVEITRRNKLFLVEDCALAPGARVEGVHAGLHGDAGVFSFYPVKHLTTAEGGMIILKDENFAKKLRLVKAFGVDRTHGERKVPGVYDTVALGFNYRMSEIHAAIGIEQMKKLPDFLKTRKANFETLEQGLAGQKGLRVLPQPTGGRLESCHYCLSVLLDESLAAKRPAIMAALTERKIGSSVYYPQPVPRMTYYREKYGYDTHRYPNAARIADGTIALPVGPHLGAEHMKHIAANLREIVNGAI
jgi:dTDP-4-amino-4,6-dideoxygalactose transaminase